MKRSITTLKTYSLPRYKFLLALGTPRISSYNLLLFPQATSLLKNNLENAKASLEVLVADLQFLRDQVTVTQVHYILSLSSLSQRLISIRSGFTFM